MEYYKRITWENLPIKELLSAIVIPDTTQAIVRPISLPIQHLIFKLLKINIDKCPAFNIMLVYFPPNTQINIHSDMPPGEPEGMRIQQGIILPLADCDQLVWSWYEPTNPADVYYKGENNSWKTVPMLPRASAKVISSTVCDKPFISDIGTFHALRNNSSKPAIAISIRLMPWSYSTVQECEELPPIDNFTICNTTST